eukprot:TRINITY_DN9962_c0_g1_i1.p1 TRINITY_DN9962_c0_g1~~TRINITY_DN9962_c0_g1_i1.p1  ORF type:complete len:438 (-),score=84.93 TRINITY_DN9962_c0_g1_i1:143-1348(-)
MALVLFGGNSWESTDDLGSRPDSHLLVVGDPGMGKSQMLRAAAHLAPRGVYVCGNTTTTSGLTVTVVRDQDTGDYALEAGALVLGDRGVCAIDEFDKMPSAHHCLLETMEQQRISIAKAGIVCNLPARTSILAAANPASGHYDRAKTVAENLKLPPAILSRFDLIYILLDTADHDRDRMLSNHVMRLHSLADTKTKIKFVKTEPATSDLSLSSRLRLEDPSSFDEIPPRLLRKYIAFAKHTVSPQLSEEAAAVLQEFYLELRKRYHTQDCTPITTRQLESLIRLSQARAKLGLRSLVTRMDAQDVVELMKESLFDVFRDETGGLDIARSSGISAKKPKMFFLNAITNYLCHKPEGLSMQHMREFAAHLGLTFKCPVDDVIESFNEQGSLLKRANGNYTLPK